MAFGLSSAGFSRKRIEDIKLEIEAELKTKFGPYINLLPQSVFGQLVGLYSERESLLWEAMEDVYNSQYPDTAEGASLDNVAALSGIVRLAATKSVVKNQLLFGTAATLVPAGTILSVSGNPAARFVTLLDTTLVAGVDEVQDLDFSLVPTSGTWKLKYLTDETSSLAFNANAAAVQAALNALPLLSGVTVAGNYTSGFTITFAGADGKQPHPLLVVSQNSLQNGVTPVTTTLVETTPGVAQGQVDCEGESTGPVSAAAQTLSVIETPVAGFASTRNPEDAILGRNTETDLELRTRRSKTLQVAGAGTVEAIRSRLLNLEGVTDVIVFENDTLVTNPQGLPPKSFEAVVRGGDDQEIVDLLWEIKPAGIQTHGALNGTVVDSQGVSRVINYSRPTLVNIYLEVDLVVNSEFPVNGVAASEEALVVKGDAFGIGKDVIVYPKLICALDEIPGIEDVVIRIGTAPSPTLDDNIQIASNEIADFDTSRVTINLI